MDPFRILWSSALLPGALAALVVLAGWLVSRHGEERRFVLAPVLGVVVSFGVGFRAVLGSWPALPLAPGTDAWHALAWGAVFSLPLGALLDAVALRPLRGALLAAAASAGLAWWLVHPFVPHARSLLEAGAAASLLALGVAAAAAGALRDARRASRGTVRLPPLLATALATAAILALRSGSLVMGEAALSLGAGLVALVVLSSVLRRPVATAGGVFAAALLLGGLFVAAWVHLDYGDVRDFPVPVALALGAGAFGGAALPGRLGAWPRVGLALAGVGVAVVLLGGGWT